MVSNDTRTHPTQSLTIKKKRIKCLNQNSSARTGSMLCIIFIFWYSSWNSFIRAWVVNNSSWANVLWTVCVCDDMGLRQLEASRLSKRMRSKNRQENKQTDKRLTKHCAGWGVRRQTTFWGQFLYEGGIHLLSVFLVTCNPSGSCSTPTICILLYISI